GSVLVGECRKEFYHHIQGLSLSYYARQKTGDLIGRMTNDVDAFQSFVSSSLLDTRIQVQRRSSRRWPIHLQGDCELQSIGGLIIVKQKWVTRFSEGDFGERPAIVAPLLLKVRLG